MLFVDRHFDVVLYITTFKQTRLYFRSATKSIYRLDVCMFYSGFSIDSYCLRACTLNWSELNVDISVHVLIIDLLLLLNDLMLLLTEESKELYVK